VFSEDEFKHLATLLEQRTGLRFSNEKQREFQLKLSELLVKGDFETGYEFIDTIRNSNSVLQDVINYLTIGESYFFRNQPHFHALEDRILPDIVTRARGRQSLNIWCAGCSTGEEPYSLSILLREKFPAVSDWKVSILATDINTIFIERAKTAVYSKWSFRGVKPEIIAKYFTQVDENRYALDASIKETVEFRRLNLAELFFENKLQEAPFDLIMCRNVLIYFSFQLANQIVAAFENVAEQGSYLMVGHSEAFPALSRLDAIYSNATYYYQYAEVSGEHADRQSVAPHPTLSIPGIGVKTVVPEPRLYSETVPPPGTARQSISVPGLPVAEYVPEYSRDSRISRVSSIIPPAPDTPEAELYDIEGALQLARDLVNEGKIQETFEQLIILAEGEGKLEPRVHFLLSIVADQAGEVGTAIKSLRQAIFLDKNFVIGHFFLGVISQREQGYEAAARCYRNVRKLTEKLPYHEPLAEAEGMTAGRLKEIAEARFNEVELLELG
jgi:chemotaxis protein methyltransferase CheR